MSVIFRGCQRRLHRYNGGQTCFLPSHLPPYSSDTKKKILDAVCKVFKYSEDDCTLTRDSENHKDLSLDRITLRRFTFFRPSRGQRYGSSISSRHCSSKPRCMGALLQNFIHNKHTPAHPRPRLRGKSASSFTLVVLRTPVSSSSERPHKMEW